MQENLPLDGAVYMDCADRCRLELGSAVLFAGTLTCVNTVIFSAGSRFLILTGMEHDNHDPSHPFVRIPHPTQRDTIHFFPPVDLDAPLPDIPAEYAATAIHPPSSLYCSS